LILNQVLFEIGQRYRKQSHCEMWSECFKVKRLTLSVGTDCVSLRSASK